MVRIKFTILKSRYINAQTFNNTVLKFSLMSERVLSVTKMSL